MLYLTRHMVALKPLTYVGEELRPGDAFAATEVDAEYFKRHKRAADKRADCESTLAPAEKPAPEIQGHPSFAEAQTDAAEENLAPEPETPDNQPVRRRPGRPRRSEAKTAE
jgi:hypothetical protein